MSRLLVFSTSLHSSLFFFLPLALAVAAMVTVVVVVIVAVFVVVVLYLRWWLAGEYVIAKCAKMRTSK